MTGNARSSQRLTILLGAVLAVAAVTAWPSAWASAIESKPTATVVHSVPEMTPVNKTRYRGWIPKQDADAILVEVSGGKPAPAIMENEAKHVAAGGFLELKARVRELNGRPVTNVPVLFEWKTKDRSQRFARPTNDEGVATVRRWIGEGERGHAAVIFVSVETKEWAASRYAWYVAE